MRTLVLMGLVALAGCSSTTNPCDGQSGGGICFALHVQGNVTGLDQLAVSVDKPTTKRLLTPSVPAPINLPVQVALIFPAGTTGTAHVGVDGIAAGRAVAHGDVTLDFAAPGSLTVTLNAGGSPDLSPAADLSSTDLSGVDLAGVQQDLASSDLSQSPPDLSQSPPDLSQSPPDLSQPPLVNHMFITSATFVAGSLGGLAGADAICTAAAQGKVPGTNWVAWLSSSTVDASSRLVLNKIAANGPARGWVRPDGKPFADTVAALTGNGKIFYPPRIDENGVDQGAVLVTTGTLSSGTKSAAGTFTLCNDWTSTSAVGPMQVGEADGSSINWTQQGASGCAGSLRLYCFSVDYSTPVAPTRPAAYRNAFLSTGLFQPGPGKSRASADALCATEASGAGLRAGTYLAFMATSTTSAASRFPSGLPWVRTDGAQIVDVDSDLFVAGPTRLRATLNVDAAGTTYFGYSFAFTGGIDQLSAGSGAGNTCNDWSDNTAGANVGIRGDASLSAFFFHDGSLSCTSGNHVYCLEQ